MWIAELLRLMNDANVDNDYGMGMMMRCDDIMIQQDILAMLVSAPVTATI